MWSALAGLLKLLPLFSFLLEWLKDRREKSKAAEMAKATVAEEEARVSRTAAEVLAERRDDSVAVSRLRDGSF